MTLRSRSRRWIAALALLAIGCGDDLPDVTQVLGTRLLGSEIHVVDAPGRTTPHPGETAEVRYQLVSPRPVPGMDELSSMFVECTFPNRYTGIPICQEFLDVLGAEDLSLMDLASAGEDNQRIECVTDLRLRQAGVGFACTSGAPVARVPVPEGFDAAAKLVRGVICDGGTPYFDLADPLLFGCDGGDTTFLTHQSVPVATDERDDNRAPNPDAFSVEISGRLWEPIGPEVDEALTDIRDNCADTAEELGVLQVDMFEHELRIGIEADELQETADGREEFVLTVHATAGEVSRPFMIFDEEARVFDSDDDADRRRCREDGQVCDTIDWRGLGVPADETDGQIVDFFITVRDQRGGFAILRRSACVHTLESFSN